MKRKILSYFSYGSLIIGAVIGAYTLADIYLRGAQFKKEVVEAFLKIDIQNKI